MNAVFWLLAGLIAGSALGFAVAALHCAALRAQLEEDHDRKMEEMALENQQLRALLSEWAEEAQEGDFP